MNMMVSNPAFVWMA